MRSLPWRLARIAEVRRECRHLGADAGAAADALGVDREKGMRAVVGLVEFAIQRPDCGTEGATGQRAAQQIDRHRQPEAFRSGRWQQHAVDRIRWRSGRLAASIGRPALGNRLPCACAKRILPIAVALIAMSTTSGSPLADGKAIAIGLLPTTRSAPPGAGISGRVLEKAKPIMAACAKRRAQ